MATGDHQTTGEAIARKVGILEDGKKVVTRLELDRMSDDELDQLIQRLYSPGSLRRTNNASSLSSNAMEGWSR